MISVFSSRAHSQVVIFLQWVIQVKTADDGISHTYDLGGGVCPNKTKHIFLRKKGAFTYLSGEISGTANRLRRRNKTALNGIVTPRWRGCPNKTRHIFSKRCLSLKKNLFSRRNIVKQSAVEKYKPAYDGISHTQLMCVSNKIQHISHNSEWAISLSFLCGILDLWTNSSKRRGKGAQWAKIASKEKYLFLM